MNKNCRQVSDALKKTIAGRQFFKCANRPNSNLKGLNNYKCLLWQRTDEHKGCFDESGYDIDHILEYSISKDDNDTNLQALCIACHRVKTKTFMSTKQNIKQPQYYIEKKKDYHEKMLMFTYYIIKSKDIIIGEFETCIDIDLLCLRNIHVMCKYASDIHKIGKLLINYINNVTDDSVYIHQIDDDINIYNDVFGCSCQCSDCPYDRPTIESDNNTDNESSYDSNDEIISIELQQKTLKEIEIKNKKYNDFHSHLQATDEWRNLIENNYNVFKASGYYMFTKSITANKKKFKHECIIEYEGGTDSEHTALPIRHIVKRNIRIFKDVYTYKHYDYTKRLINEPVITIQFDEPLIICGNHDDLRFILKINKDMYTYNNFDRDYRINKCLHNINMDELDKKYGSIFTVPCSTYIFSLSMNIIKESCYKELKKLFINITDVFNPSKCKPYEKYKITNCKKKSYRDKYTVKYITPILDTN